MITNKMKKTTLALIIISMFILATASASATSGRLNAQGCHNSKTAGYHCHRSPAEMQELKEIKKTKQTPPTPNKQSVAKKTAVLKKAYLPETKTKKTEELTTNKVTNIIDGDTIEITIEGKKEKVRLLGIDTPETYTKKECYGKEASEQMKKLAHGKEVRLESDSTQPNRDKYGRLLRYVYLPDGKLVNRELVKTGHARAYTKYGSDKLKEFLEVEREAKNKKQGMWKTCK